MISVSQSSPEWVVLFSGWQAGGTSQTWKSNCRKKEEEVSKTLSSLGQHEPAYLSLYSVIVMLEVKS